MAFINTVVGRAAASIWNLKLGAATTNAVLAQINALGANDAAVSGVVNSAFNSVYSSYSNADIAAAFVNNLGVTGTARADGLALVLAELNGVDSAARGAKLLEIANLFSQLETDATYGAAARAFNAKVAAAVIYSGQAGTVDATFAGSGAVTSFYLTTGQDFLQGTPGDDLFLAYEFAGVGTLQSGDVINGGAGNDTLYADLRADTHNIITPILTNIENVAFRAQTVAGTTGDNNISDVNRVVIDAERIDGEKRYESNNSRADLIIEDVRIASSQITKDITVAFVESDPGHVDFALYFDQQDRKSVV